MKMLIIKKARYQWKMLIIKKSDMVYKKGTQINWNIEFGPIIH